VLSSTFQRGTTNTIDVKCDSSMMDNERVVSTKSSPGDTVEIRDPQDVEWEGMPNSASSADDGAGSLIVDIQGSEGRGARVETSQTDALTRVQLGPHQMVKKDESALLSKVEDGGSPSLQLARQERVDSFQPEPGAYRIRDGASPQRASSFVSNITAREPLAPNAVNRATAYEATVLVEASLVAAEGGQLDAEESAEPRNAALVVEATPIRQSRWTTKTVLAVAGMAVLAIIATVVGTAVGLTRESRQPLVAQEPPPSTNVPSTLPSFFPSTLPSSLPSTVPSFSPSTLPSLIALPTSAPSSRLNALFLQALPLHTRESIDDTSSPQFNAFEWITGHINDLEIDQQDDGDSPWLANLTQRFALATLYFATGGEISWNGTARWLDVNAHECTWLGCCCGTSCTASGALASLTLESNGLARIVPREIGLLTSLELLNLGGNALSGSTPTDLGELSVLSFLNLYGNRLSSTIPTELGILSRLTDLRLSMNSLTGTIPSELGNLSALTELYLYSNHLSRTIPSQIGQLKGLGIVALRSNNLTGPIPTELAELSALTTLYLHNNQLSSTIPTQLGRLSNLQDLRLLVNRLTGSIPTELGQLSTLDTLWLESNRMNGTIPTQLGDLSGLIDLTLAGNQLSGSIPTHLGKLTALTSIWLNQNRLTSTIPTELGLLSNLDSTYPILLGGNSLSGSVPSELCQVVSARNLNLRVDCVEVTCSCSCSCAETAADDFWY
jgi:Leucine-rich repeat (LRR) protein